MILLACKVARASPTTLSGLCSLFEVGESRSNLRIGHCIDGFVNGVVVLKCVPKGKGPVSLAVKVFRWCSEELRVDLGHNGYCGYWCTCLGCCLWLRYCCCRAS